MNDKPSYPNDNLSPAGNTDAYHHYSPLPLEEVEGEMSAAQRAEAELREIVATHGGSTKALDQAVEPSGKHFDEELWGKAQGNEKYYYRLKAVKNAEKLAMENPHDAAHRETLSIMQREVRDMQDELGIDPETRD